MRCPMGRETEPEGQTHPIRVLVADFSRTLPLHAVEMIRQQPDMVVVEQARDRVALLAASRRADVVLLSAGQTAPPPGICSHLLSEFPCLRILVYAAGGGALYWFGLRHDHSDITLAGLL